MSTLEKFKVPLECYSVLQKFRGTGKARLIHSQIILFEFH